MSILPKRRKKKDNPYTLLIEDNKYYVLFKDNKCILHKIEVSKELFNEFDSFELQDIKELNEYDRHIEHSEIYENNINSKAKDKPITIEDKIIQKSTFEELKEAINKLPEIQKRRIKKYYFEDKNEYEIAIEENTSQQAINKSLKNALKKLEKILKN